jgi:hypothetical protein
VICGPEHSGTTLVSDLFRQVPGIDAGFEVGVLLADTPRQFPALEIHAEITRWGWGVDDETLKACCDTDDFRAFYARLRAASSVLKPATATIFDKTPRYLGQLPSCMAKLDVPFIIVFKDPRALVFSDWRKAGAPPFEAWFDTYAPAKLGHLLAYYAHYRSIRDRGEPRACLIRLEDLCLDARRTCERMYAHVGCSFDPAYMVLQNTRYVNTRLGAVSAGVPFAYAANFSAGQKARIVAAFAGFAEWFYD